MSLSAFWSRLLNCFQVDAKYTAFHASVYYDSLSRKVSVSIDGPECGGLLIKIYDSSMNFLGQLPAKEGIVPVPDLPDGRYFYKLITLKGDLIKKGRFNVTVMV